MTRCEGCNRETSDHLLEDVDVMTAKQTYSSPAEYEAMQLCDICRDPDVEERVAFDRADAIYRDRTGSHL
jgi:hypothetical protein